MGAACFPFLVQREYSDGSHFEQRVLMCRHLVCCGLEGRRRTAPPHGAFLVDRLIFCFKWILLFKERHNKKETNEYTWDIMETSIDQFRSHCRGWDGMWKGEVGG